MIISSNIKVIILIKHLITWFIALVVTGPGTGIGIIFGSLLEAYARHPSLEKKLFSYAILGFALTEAIALFALMISFLILFFTNLMIFLKDLLKTVRIYFRNGVVTTDLHGLFIEKYLLIGIYVMLVLGPLLFTSYHIFLQKNILKEW